MFCLKTDIYTFYNLKGKGKKEWFKKKKKLNTGQTWNVLFTRKKRLDYVNVNSHCTDRHIPTANSHYITGHDFSDIPLPDKPNSTYLIGKNKISDQSMPTLNSNHRSS